MGSPSRGSWIPRAVGLAILLSVSPGWAWDYPGHRLVNRLALSSLPAEFPAFVQQPDARERIGFLGGEADRWRNAPELTFRHVANLDHYLDLDDLVRYGLTPEQVSPFRYEFAAQLALARAAHPEMFPAIDPARNADHTREWVGFLPWTITEHCAKLKSGFACWRTFQQSGGTPEEIANAQQNLIYLMGVMGHFVADGAQPLHLTKHYNGWMGPNPRGYSTSRRLHAWIDGGFIAKAGIEAGPLRTRMRPARRLTTVPADEAGMTLFPVVMQHLQLQAKQVEPLYELDQAGKLSVEPVVHPAGVAFLSAQLLTGAQMLGDLWLTAWMEAGADKFLEEALKQRQASQESSIKKGSQP